MITKQHIGATVSAAAPPDCILPNPPKTPDMRQRAQLTKIDVMLQTHFSERGDVLVSGEGYLRHNGTNASERLSPDCVVAFGVDPKAVVRRNGYVISEVGKPPDLVIEVASKSTGTRDYTTKREGYERYRAREYWRSDETGGRWHDSALAGDTLVDGVYVPIEIIQDEDGRYWGYSEVLDLHLCWDDGQLRFFDAKSESFLPDHIELKEEGKATARERDAATRERDEMAIERDAAARERDEMATERDAAARERDRLAAENERLRALLRQAGLDK